MIHFTADLHLGHNGILKHQEHRAALFGDVDTMDGAIIDSINHHVDREDELWILGDFAWKASNYGHYRSRLRVRKLHVVKGNHDSSSLRSHVSSMDDIVYRKFAGVKFQLCHYPLASWRAREHGSVHLYGHSHGKMEAFLNQHFPNRRSIDVGIDHAYQLFGDFRPFSLAEIFSRLNVVEHIDLQSKEWV